MVVVRMRGEENVDVEIFRLDEDWELSIETEGQMAIDVFYLTSDGSKLTAGQRERLQAALLEELSGRTPPS